MYKLTKSDIERLKPLEPYFLQIIEHYKRSSLISEDMVASEYYEKLTGKVEKNFACGQCSFRMYSTVADAYWQALKENETTTTTENKPKTVKKKKTNERKRRVTKEKK